MKSIVSYPERGNFGDNKYRGNCSGLLIKDLLVKYKPTKFIEIFAGGGTGYEVAKSLGITNSLHLDLNPKWGAWNALKDEIPAGSDFVFSHPPYHDIIPYSGSMWGEPHPDDLSRCQTYDEFIHKLNIVNAKIYNSLRKGGRHAFLVGDVRQKGKYYSIIKDMVWYGDLDSHVIKEQHNVWSSKKNYSNTQFIPIAHEHLLIFKKGEVWAVNLKITHDEKRNLLDSKLVTWRDLIQSALQDLGGTARLPELYEKLKTSERAKNNEHWQAKIRQTLQRSDEFAPCARGVWTLQYSQEYKTA